MDLALIPKCLYFDHFYGHSIQYLDIFRLAAISFDSRHYHCYPLFVMSNTISLRAYKTLKECQKLFHGYRDRLGGLDKTDLLVELERYKQESARYPHHLLTVVKGEILMGVLREKSLTEEMRTYALSEERRLRIEMQKRLQEEWQQKSHIQ